MPLALYAARKSARTQAGNGAHCAARAGKYRTAVKISPSRSRKAKPSSTSRTRVIDEESAAVRTAKDSGIDRPPESFAFCSPKLTRCATPCNSKSGGAQPKNQDRADREEDRGNRESGLYIYSPPEKTDHHAGDEVPASIYSRQSTKGHSVLLLGHNLGRQRILQ